MGETRLSVEELLALCLQRISLEENNVNAELGDPETHHQVHLYALKLCLLRLPLLPALRICTGGKEL